MRLDVECQPDTFPITISADHEPFAEMRGVFRMLRDAGKRPYRVVCDREARHWMDVHMLHSRNAEFVHSLTSDAGDVVTWFHDVPVVIEDEPPGL